MRRLALRSIDALVDTIVQDTCPDHETIDLAVIRSYVRETVSGMPDYVRLGILGAAITFECWSIPRKGRGFHSLRLHDKLAQLQSWRTGRLGFQRAMVAFFTTFTTFGLYSLAHPALEPQQKAIVT